MNSKKNLVFLSTVFAIALLFVPIYSVAADHKKGSGMHGSMMKHGHGHAHSYAKMIASQAEALQLTDEQLGKIVRLHMQGQKEHQKLKEKMHKSHHAFKDAGMQPSTDDATLDKLAKEHATAQQAMLDYHLNERKAVHGILTAEQLSKLKTIKMPHGKHGDDHGGAGHGQEGKEQDGGRNKEHAHH